MTFFKHCFFAFGILWFSLGAGCKGKDPMATDAAGYQCTKCQFKFYTDQDVIPQFCPSCKSGDIAGIVGYICSKDNHLTIPPMDGKEPVCEQCGTLVRSITPLTAAQLQTWGATKKTLKEVCAK